MATKTTPSISEAVERYLRTRAVAMSASTYENDKCYLRKLAWYLTDKQVGRISAADVERFVYAFLEGDPRVCSKPLTLGSVHRLRSTMTGFLSWASRQGWTKLTSAAEAAPLPPRGNIRKDYIHLSPAELMQLLDVCEHPRDRAYCAVAINTGLRCSTITSIRLRDVHLDAGYIYVRISKTRETDRLQITADLDRELRAWLAWYAEHAGPLAGDWYLVPAKKRRVFIARAVLEPTESVALRPTDRAGLMDNIVQKALMRLGYPAERLDKEGTHTLRRSAAVAFRDLLMASGVDDVTPVVSAFLHHKSEPTTRLYLGWQREKDVRDAALGGRGFLSRLVEPPDNVVHLDARRQG